MKHFIKEKVRAILKRFNIGISSYSTLQYLKELEKLFFWGVPNISDEKLMKIVPLLRGKSKSQQGQDLFVLLELDFKRNGFFVEFGAADGIKGSNTYFLDKEFGWNGILAEPAKGWHNDLKRNRSCYIETNCVWRDSKSVLKFNEVDNENQKGLSTISDYNDSDNHKKARRGGVTYNVSSISLVDLLDKYNAPKTIDYLSIDTEGSEYDILCDFDFSRYRFNTITVEHNYTRNRKKIFKLLTENGYERKYTALSRWDDWYVYIK